ncbi:LysR family transcriptional regulator [Rhodococcus sp. G-MC3]|uniref:LysR family transcriptional regulator n=1 Tax=Rhodococcus sp. G-MC3 TaxID=3046209 RepID=UPI0024B91F5F|nr:LysR family transcriptional regulator [Rhodococcus sp. G-MC3]MDJ0394852.1 LysR family transcriptional regulator [Rhodococcus sp. G-MC3]
MQRRPDVTLTQLRYFVAAASHSNMTKAAEQLLVAQSAVSSAISQLEHQIGTQLFIRQPSRGLVLTAAGEEMLRDTQSLLAHLGEVLDTARGHEDVVRGTVKLACFVTLTPFVLPSLISDLRRIHPELVVDVLETQAASVRAELRNGTCELAITYDLALHPDLESEVIGHAPPHVILAADHRLAGADAIALADLADEPMVLLDLPSSRDYFLSMLRGVGVEPVVRYRSASYETVRGLVARGHGFSILNQEPADGGRTYDGGQVVAIPIADDVPVLPVVIVRLRGVRSTARARAVADRARAHFASRRAAPTS